MGWVEPMRVCLGFGGKAMNEPSVGEESWHTAALFLDVALACTPSCLGSPAPPPKGFSPACCSCSPAPPRP